MFHHDAIRELCRIAREIQIFPLLALGGRRSPYVDRSVEEASRGGARVSIETVPISLDAAATDDAHSNARMTEKNIAVNRTAWLVQRSILAIALMLGFYALALGMAGAFLGIIYVQVVYGDEISIRLAVPCLFFALAILFTMVPRRDRFVAPGPRVEESDEPRLFAFVREIANDMGERLPTRSTCCSAADAWVTQRGGFMGFASRRVMGIGLPLLQALPVPEMRAVLAHEFGHYASRDVKLGPWIL